ncbi:hypothetical protein Tsubulata_039823, partial [Turnera subulata]
QSRPTPTYTFSSIQHLVGSQKGQSVTGLYSVKQYLKNFGYLDHDYEISKNHADNNYFDDILESAIKSYQQTFHLKVTGHLDNHTVHQMMRPRCGFPDILNNKNNTTSSSKPAGPGISNYEFMPRIPRWTVKHLTYKFRPGRPLPGTENLKSVCRQAFQRWADVTDFSFQEVPFSSKSHIEIAILRGDHGDGVPFDGPSGTFAHAFQPGIGLLHFDADERWSSSPGGPQPSQVDMESVAVHEIGHVLGLAHSPDHPEAIMYPSFDFGIIKRNLQEDDIVGIRHLVGSQKGQIVTGLYSVKQYLKKFGFLNYDDEISENHADNNYFDDILESAIKSYQQTFHLKVTGHLDNHTVHQMMRPRCGFPDTLNNKSNTIPSSKPDPGISDYAFYPGYRRWTEKHLTYKFRPGRQVPGTEYLKSVCKRAFQRWADVADLTFQEVASSSASHIEIAFFSGDHGDGHPFDGPGSIFAHGFPPRIGQLHFDADEPWSSSATGPQPSQLDLESVAVHELGHVLGLAHSPDHPEAIMYPYFDYGLIKRNLGEDDIVGIRNRRRKTLVEDASIKLSSSSL